MFFPWRYSVDFGFQWAHLNVGCMCILGNIEPDEFYVPSYPYFASKIGASSSEVQFLLFFSKWGLFFFK